MDSLTVALAKLQVGGSPVTWNGEDIRAVKAAVYAMCEKLSFSWKACRNKSVLIHPNLVRPNPRRIPASYTDPRVILALCELAVDMGAAEVVVGENPGFRYPARSAFREAGLEAPLKRLGVRVSYFDEADWVRVPNRDAMLFRDIQVAKAVLDAEVFINVPKWKTHMLTLVSLSLKNLLGIIHDDQRMLFHRNDIAEKIVDIARVRRPDLNVIDGLWAMEGQAPFHGDAIEDYGGLAAGTDMYAVDKTAAELMGFREEEIPHLMIARERLWGGEPPEIEVEGPVAALKRSFKRPALSSAGWFPKVRAVECGVCRGCLSAIRHSLDKLHFEGNLDRLPRKVTVVSGRPMCNRTTLGHVEGPLVLFGNCAAEFQFYSADMRQKGTWIPGCPPHVLDLEKVLLRWCDGEE